MSAPTRGVWQHVNSAELSHLWTIYFTDGVLQACRQAIFNNLLSMGIMYADLTFSTLPSQEFFHHVQRHYVEFCKDVVDAIIVQGFVAYTITKDEAVPRVVPTGIGDYRIRLTESLEVEMGWFLPGDDHEKPQKDIFFFKHTMPSLSGHVRSAISSYARTRLFKDFVERTTAVAERIRSKPPIYVSTRSAHAFNEKMLYHEAGITPQQQMQNSMSVEREKQNSVAKNRIVLESFRQQRELVDNLNYFLVDTGTPGWDRIFDPTTGLPKFDQDAEAKDDIQGIVPLPNDSDVCSAPSPNSRPDLVKIQEFTALQACMVMGVSPSSVGGMFSAAARSSVIRPTDDAFMHSTLERFRYDLTRILIDIYKLVFKDDADKPVTVVFPQLQSQARMHALFQSNILTYDAYKAYIASTMQLRTEDLEQADPRLARATLPNMPQPNRL